MNSDTSSKSKVYKMQRCLPPQINFQVNDFKKKEKEEKKPHISLKSNIKAYFKTEALYF